TFSAPIPVFSNAYRGAPYMHSRLMVIYPDPALKTITTAFFQSSDGLFSVTEVNGAWSTAKRLLSFDNTRTFSGRIIYTATRLVDAIENHEIIANTGSDRITTAHSDTSPDGHHHVLWATSN